MRFILFILLSSANVCFGTTFYVSTLGKDTNSCSSSAPCRNILTAYAKTQPGDTVIVKSGIYTHYKSGYGNHLGRNGTSLKPITVKSEVPYGAVIDLQNKSNAHSGFYVTGSYNVIQGFRIRNGYHGGVELEGNYTKIIGNEILNNGNKVPISEPYGQDGISGKGSNAIIDRNHIHHNGRTGSNLDHGLYLQGDNNVVTNNIITHNAAMGIQIAGYDTVSNMKVYNNTIAFNGKNGIIIWKKMAGVDIRNNILYKNKSYAWTTYNASGTGVVFQNNILYGNTYLKAISPAGSIVVKEVNPIFLNPLFISESSNYRVKLGSPAIDRGVSASVNHDYDNLSRPRGKAIDIGAFEK